MNADVSSEKENVKELQSQCDTPARHPIGCRVGGVTQIHSSDNLANLFTKSLPTLTFKKLIHKIRTRPLKVIDMRESMLMT